MRKAWYIIEPADSVDILIQGALLEHVVAEVEHGQLVVDEDGFREELQVAVGQVSAGRQLIRGLK